MSRLFSAWKDKFRFQQERFVIWPITGKTGCHISVFLPVHWKKGADKNDKRFETYTEMYYKKFHKYLAEFLTNDDVPFEAFAKMVVKYKDDRDRV